MKVGRPLLLFWVFAFVDTWVTVMLAFAATIFCVALYFSSEYILNKVIYLLTTALVLVGWKSLSIWLILRARRSL